MNDLEEHMPVKLWNNMTKKGLTNLDICIIYCPKILDLQKQTEPRTQYKSHEPHGYLLLSNPGFWWCWILAVQQKQDSGIGVSYGFYSKLLILKSLQHSTLRSSSHPYPPLPFRRHFDAKPNRFPVACEVCGLRANRVWEMASLYYGDISPVGCLDKGSLQQ